MSDEQIQQRLLQSQELNKLAINERRNGNYEQAVALFTQAINIYPAEPYFFNRGLAYLACINDFSKVSLSADDMFVALLMGYLSYKGKVNECQLGQSLMYYVDKMMQINLLNENILLKNIRQKALYRIYILADKYAAYSNYVQHPENESDQQVFEYFASEDFDNAFNSYVTKYTIGPFRMELTPDLRNKWLLESRADVAICLKSSELIEAAREILDILFE